MYKTRACPIWWIRLPSTGRVTNDPTMKMLAASPATAGVTPNRSVATFDMTIMSSRKTTELRKLTNEMARKLRVQGLWRGVAGALVVMRYTMS